MMQHLFKKYLSRQSLSCVIPRLNGEKIKTLEELGHQYGFSKERIRQLESSILQKIRANNSISHLKDYLN